MHIYAHANSYICTHSQVQRRGCWLTRTRARCTRFHLRLQGQLESTQLTLHDTQNALSSCKQDKAHFEKVRCAACVCVVACFPYSYRCSPPQSTGPHANLCRCTHNIPRVEAPAPPLEALRVLCHALQESERLGEEATRLAAELHKASAEVSRLREWQDVLKKVQEDKLREEGEKHAGVKAELEAAAAALERQLSSAQAGCSQRDERLAAKDAEVDGTRKQVALLQLQLREAGKHAEQVQKDKAATAKALDDARAQLARLQQQVHAMTLTDKEKEKVSAMAAGSMREALAADKAVLQSKVDEALKEAAVQKMLAEGCLRDIRVRAFKTAMRWKYLPASVNAFVPLSVSLSARHCPPPPPNSCPRGQWPLHTQACKSPRPP